MKYFIILIFIFITACSTNGNNSFDILEDAKKFIVDITKSVEPDKKEEKIIEKDESASNKKNKVDDKKEKKETKKNDELLVAEKLEVIKNRKKKEENNKNLESRLIKKREYKENYEENLLEFEKEEIGDLEVQEYPENKFNKIGVLLPLSGEKSRIGKNILNGLELALFQKQEKKVELIIRDTKADPEHTKKAFEEFLSLNIKVILGPLYTKSLLSIEEMASENNINIFALTNNTKLAKKGIWIFGIDPGQQAESILKFSFLKGNKKFAFLLPNNPYGHLLKDEVEDTLDSFNLVPERIEFFDNTIKGQEAAAKKISRGFLSYEEKLKEVEDLNNIEGNNKLPLEDTAIMPFDSVFIAASGQDLTIIASQLQYNGVDPKKVTFLGTAAWENNEILREPALDGGFYSATSDSYKEQIKGVFKNIYKEDMSNISMIAYDILALLSAGIDENKANKNEFLTKKQGFIGLRGLFRLTNRGKVERVFQIKKIRNKKFITYKKEPDRFAKHLY